MMKIAYIEKPGSDSGEYERWDDIKFLTEDQYNQLDRWSQYGYDRIVYALVKE
jgi:hypothetical protein